MISRAAVRGIHVRFSTDQTTCTRGNSRAYFVAVDVERPLESYANGLQLRSTISGGSPAADSTEEYPSINQCNTKANEMTT